MTHTAYSEAGDTFAKGSSASAYQIGERLIAALNGALSNGFSDDEPPHIFMPKIFGDQSSLPGWQELNELLRLPAFPVENLVLANSGKTLDRSEYCTNGTLNPSLVRSAIDKGATVLLNRASDMMPALQVVSECLRYELRCEVECNLFATFGNSQAFQSHFDEVDAIVVQLEGEKHWQLHGVGQKNPLPAYNDSSIDNCPQKVEFEKIVETGDLLYFKRGNWHTVKGAGTSSLHATFSISRLTNLNYLYWCASQLISDEITRADIKYLTTDLYRKGNDHNAHEYLTSLMSGYSTADYFDYMQTTNRSNPPLLLISPRQEKPVYINTARYKPHVYSDQEKVWFHLDGKTHRLPVEYKNLLQNIFAYKVVDVSRIEPTEKMRDQLSKVLDGLEKLQVVSKISQ